MTHHTQSKLLIVDGHDIKQTIEGVFDDVGIAKCGARVSVEFMITSRGSELISEGDTVKCADCKK